GPVRELHQTPETVYPISWIHAREVGCETQHEKPILGLSETLCRHKSCPPAVRACEAETFGECSFQNDIASNQTNPVPFDLFTATVKQSRFVGIYFLNSPYSSEVRMRIEPNQRFPHGIGTEFAFIWQWEIVAVLEYNFLVNIVY